MSLAPRRKGSPTVGEQQLKNRYFLFVLVTAGLLLALIRGKCLLYMLAASYALLLLQRKGRREMPEATATFGDPGATVGMKAMSTAK